MLKSWHWQRAIDMLATLTRALQRLAERPHGPLVFGGPDGKPLDPDNLSHRRFPGPCGRPASRGTSGSMICGIPMPAS